MEMALHLSSTAMMEMRKRSSKSEIRMTLEASSATTTSSKRRRWTCSVMMMAFVYRVKLMVVSEEDEGRFEDAQEGGYDEEMEEDIDEEEQDTQRYIQRQRRQRQEVDLMLEEGVSMGEEDILGEEGCENPEERPKVRGREENGRQPEEFKLGSSLEDGRIDIVEEYEATIGV